MNKYQIILRPAALRQLKKINKKERLKLFAAIELLAQDPRPPASRQLKGRDGWRVRVGNYRIIYTIDDGVLIITIIAVGHRRDVYR
jgi:mRNA interferase RelE/StbE